jgi:hypothetical protein
MIHKFPRLRLLLVAGLVHLLAGTGMVCNVASAQRAEACCEVATSGCDHDAPTSHADAHHGPDHANHSAPPKSPDSGKPDLCCSTWYVFTVDSTPSPTGVPRLPLSSPVIDLSSPAMHGSAAFVVDFIRTGGIGNNRAPNPPLFLISHSIRV